MTATMRTRTMKAGILQSIPRWEREVGDLVQRTSEPDIIYCDDDPSVVKRTRQGISRWEREVGHLVQQTLEPDIIYFDDDPSDLRWKMPCGHVMSRDGIKELCKSEVKHGKVRICCPQCSAEWGSSLIQALADMSLEEGIELEVALEDNNHAKGKPTKLCPRCLTICERESTNNPRVSCQVCTKKMFTLYEFCWHCLGKWNTGNTTNCGNSNCKGEDPALEKLRECTLKEFLGRSGKFPSMRACPECHLLIEHTDGCKQMVCEKCKTKFCFICLKKAIGANYQCGGYNSECDVAPIQTDLFK